MSGYWSMTLYNNEHFFHPNSQKPYSLGTRNKNLQQGPTVRSHCTSARSHREPTRNRTGSAITRHASSPMMDRQSARRPIIDN